MKTDPAIKEIIELYSSTDSGGLLRGGIREFLGESGIEEPTILQWRADVGKVLDLPKAGPVFKVMDHMWNESASRAQRRIYFKLRDRAPMKGEWDRYNHNAEKAAASVNYHRLEANRLRRRDSYKASMRWLDTQRSIGKLKTLREWLATP